MDVDSVGLLKIYTPFALTLINRCFHFMLLLTFIPPVNLIFTLYPRRIHQKLYFVLFFLGKYFVLLLKIIIACYTDPKAIQFKVYTFLQIFTINFL